MSIYINNKELQLAYLGNKALNAIYKGAKIVWEAALRIWKGKQLWKGKETWKY